MSAIEAILLNFQETRRRSIKVWRSLPDEQLSWRLYMRMAGLARPDIWD